MAPNSWTAAVGAALCAAIALAAGASHAQEPPKALTLEQALLHARQHVPSLAVARARIAAAAADAELPHARWRPTVGASAQGLVGTVNNTTASYLGSAVLDLPRVGGTKATDFGSLSPEPSTLVGVSARQLLFDGGRLAAQQAAADAVVDVQRQLERSAWLDVALNVEESWFAAQAAHQVLASAQAAEQRAQLYRDQAAVQSQHGLRPPSEKFRADAEFGRATVERMRAETGLEVAQSVLAAAVGSSDERVDTTADASAPQALPSFDVALQHALEHAPRLLAAQMRLQAQRAQTQAASADANPNLYAAVGANLRAGGAKPSSGPEPRGEGWLPTVPNWFAGLVLNWPLLDGDRQARVGASQAREVQLQAEFADLQWQRRAQVQRAFLEVRRALQTIAAYDRALEVAQANVKQAESRFGVGLGTGIEVADAAARLADAEVQRALGRFAANRARAQLARAMAEELYVIPAP